MRICFSVSDIIGVDDSQKRKPKVQKTPSQSGFYREHKLQSHICAPLVLWKMTAGAVVDGTKARVLKIGWLGRG
jgi:hypothetical protein